MGRFCAVISALAMSLALGGAATRVLATTPLTTERVASGLSLPLFVTAPPGDTTRAFIVEQRGSGGVANRADIRILDLTSGTLNATPFLSISPVSTGSEQGMLGLAFHPDYASNGFFYVDYTDSTGTTVIARYHVSADPDIADAASAQTVVTIAQPYANHNAGWIGFGPQDGYLYIAMGDGGNSNDPDGNGQNLNVLLGKMLRIDVDSDDFPADPAANYAIPPTNPFAGATPGLDEIWAYGLRNPWRDSFDRVTHDLYIADVGQGAWEEIDYQPAFSAGGENYGWRCMEGNHCTELTGCTCDAPELTLPIYEYDHSASRCSITGGYVYRGCAIPDLRGAYFFADYCSANIWSFRYSGGVLTDFQDRTAELDPPGALAINSVTGFGEDGNGELYICDRGGEVFRIIPNGPADPPAQDDYDNDGDVDLFDVASFVACQSSPEAAFTDCLCDVFDADGDGDTDLADFAALQVAFTG